jgi:hypothetical protein
VTHVFGTTAHRPYGVPCRLIIVRVGVRGRWLGGQGRVGTAGCRCDHPERRPPVRLLPRQVLPLSTLYRQRARTQRKASAISRWNSPPSVGRRASGSADGCVTPDPSRSRDQSSRLPTSNPATHSSNRPATPPTILDVRRYHDTKVTYDLTIDGLHTYYVEAGATPVLVHNSAGCGIGAEAQSTANHANARFNDPGGFEHYVTGVNPKALSAYVDGVLEGKVPNLDVRYLNRGRVAYWDPNKAAVVIEDGEGGTVFTPTDGKTYFDDLK